MSKDNSWRRHDSLVSHSIKIDTAKNGFIIEMGAYEKHIATGFDELVNMIAQKIGWTDPYEKITLSIEEIGNDKS